MSTRVSSLFVLSLSIFMVAGAETHPAAKKPAAPAAAASPEFTKLSKAADAAREANRVDESVQLYRRALKLRPGWGVGWWWLGTLLYDTDQYPACRDAFQKFVSVDANAGPGFAFLGLCEFQTKEYDKAVAHLEHARKLGLGDNKQFVNVALYHDAMLLTKYEQYEPAAKLLLELGRNMDCAPSIVEASGIAALRRPLLPSEVPADQKPLVVNLGRAFCLTGNRRGAEAQKYFEDAAAAYPQEPNVHYSFGSFLMSTDPDRGLAEYKKTLELDPKHLPTLVSIVFEYLKRGEPELALPYARSAVEYAPKSFATHASLGRALIETGDVEKGIKELEISVQMAPDSPQTRIALASAYAKVGRKEDAARERAEFLKLKKQAEAVAPQ